MNDNTIMKRGKKELILKQLLKYVDSVFFSKLLRYFEDEVITNPFLLSIENILNHTHFRQLTNSINKIN